MSAQLWCNVYVSMSLSYLGSDPSQVAGDGALLVRRRRATSQARDRASPPPLARTSPMRLPTHGTSTTTAFRGQGLGPHLETTAHFPPFSYTWCYPATSTRLSRDIRDARQLNAESL